MMNHRIPDKITTPVLLLAAVVMALAAVVIATERPADATNGNVTGEGYCIDATTWGAHMTWNATNVPDDVEGDVKVLGASAGTLTPTPGAGVMADTQVILSAWTSHASNWPGAPVHHGNYSEAFSVVAIPTAVDTITVTVQYDYSNGHSDDPIGTVSKPNDCAPPAPTPTPTDTPTAPVSETPTPSATPSTSETPSTTPSPSDTPSTTPPTTKPPTVGPPPTVHTPPSTPGHPHTTRVCKGGALEVTHYDANGNATFHGYYQGADQCKPAAGSPPDAPEEGY